MRIAVLRLNLKNAYESITLNLIYLTHKRYHVLDRISNLTLDYSQDENNNEKFNFGMA